MQRSFGQSGALNEPSNGSPGVMSPITPIAAPPAAMLEILAVKVHVPRSTSTTLPVSVPAANGAQPSRLPPAPSPYWTGTFVLASAAVSGLDHDWKTASRGTNAPPVERSIAKPVDDGTAVWATDRADGAEDGEPTMYGLSLLLPAEATTRVPAAVAVWTAALRSSSGAGPYGEPSDMLMMSAASAVEPSPLGSSAKSMPWISARPEHDVLMDEQTLIASSFAAGATPVLPAMMSATWVPCDPSQASLMAPGPHGIGSGSLDSGGLPAPPTHSSPTKSQPPTTFAVGYSFVPL